MAFKILMPKMGASMEEAKITKWLVKPGDHVNKGDMVAEIETDKVNIEVEAFAAGQVLSILAEEGATVPVGQVIAIIGEPGETITEALPAAVPAPEIAGTPEHRPMPAPTRPTPAGRVLASPLAKNIASQLGIDIATVRGSGPGGRVVRADVELAASSAPAAAAAPSADESHRVAASPMRRAIARQMTLSKQTVPHFYVTVSVDMTRAQRLRGELNEIYAPDKVSVNDLILVAVAKALRKFPQVNSSWQDQAIVARESINIGIAIALEDGLIVPVIHDADKLSLRQMGAAVRRLAEGSKAGKLSAQDMSDATFTVTNLGMFGAESFCAIINPPESAILAAGTIESVAVGKDGAIVLIDQMKLTLSGDHRSIDGATGARFLQEIKGILERPLVLVSE